MADNDLRPYGSSRGPCEIVPPEQRAVREARNRRSIEFGAAWLIGGVLLTVITYEQARATGAYLLAWGPMLYGGYRIVSGLQLLNRSRKSP
ncbi:hypothetical protein ACWD26_02005 [Streptomyces sp. NPDC002787]